MAIRFIYFDLGNVLLLFDHRRAAAQMAEAAGISVEQVWDVIFESGLLLQVESGQISDPEFYEIFCEATKTKADYVELQRAGSDIFQPNRPIIPLVGHLHAAGYRLGILSNTSQSHWEFVSQGSYGYICRGFYENVLSYEVRSAKPNPEIYQVAIERAGVAAEEIFFTDDRPENVAGARSAGIDAVLFTDVKQLAIDLCARNVRCNY